MTSKLPLKANWTYLKTKLKEKYPQLSDSDLTLVEGKEDQFMEKLQIKTHKPLHEIKREIERLLQTTTPR